MKKLYLIALAAAAGALSASAAAPAAQLPLKPAIATVRSLQAKKAVGTVKASPAKAAAKADAAEQWTEIGNGYFVDDISTSFFYVSPTTYEVKILEDKANPGMYRAVNIWANNPNVKALIESGATFDLTDGAYLTFDATNPDYVRVLESPDGMADPAGPTTVKGLTEMVGQSLGQSQVTQEIADMAAGKLANGTITFPVAKSVAIIQGEDIYVANGSGKLALYLPGAETPVDYTLSLKLAEYFCPDNNNDYHVTITGDSRIPTLKWTTVATLPDDDAAIDALINDCAANGNVAKINETFAVNVAKATTSSVVLVVLAIDENGIAQDARAGSLNVPTDDAGNWEYSCHAYFTEGLMSSVLPVDFKTETYRVVVEKHKADPGLIRVRDPYAGWSYTDCVANHSHSHFIVFNITDPDCVYVIPGALGVVFEPFGEWGLSSDYAEVVEQYGKEFCDWLGFSPGGHLKDDVISFTSTDDLKLLPVNYGKYVYANWKNNPDYDEAAAEAAAAAGQTYNVPQYLPGDFKLDMSAAGINDALINSEAVQPGATYFTLQGQRIANPTRGTVCIRVQGAKADKVVIF